MDPATSEFFRDGVYDYAGEGVKRTIEEHAKYLAGLVSRYPIASIEDAMAEDDLKGWKLLMGMLGNKCQPELPAPGRGAPAPFCWQQ